MIGVSNSLRCQFGVWKIGQDVLLDFFQLTALRGQIIGFEVQSSGDDVERGRAERLAAHIDVGRNAGLWVEPTLC